MSTSSEHSCLHMDLCNALLSAERDYSDLYKEIDAYQPTGLNQNLAPEIEKKLIFGNRIQAARIIIVILSSTLLEAYINYYIALKTTAEQFSALEKATLIEKWVTVPSLFIQGYEVKKSTALFNDLRCLVDHRNRLVHTKPRIITDGHILHEGYFPKNHKSEHKIIQNYITLPLRLLKHLISIDKAIAINLIISSGYPQKEF